MIKGKRLVALSLAALMAIATTGCSKEEDGKPTYEELEANYILQVRATNDAKEEVESLKSLLYTYDPNLAEVEGVGAVKQLPTGESAYFSINDTIRFGEQLEIKPSSVLPNNTTIKLVDNVSYRPGNNWSFNLENGNVSLHHKNGMFVTVRAYNYLGRETVFSLEEAIITPYLDSLEVEKLSSKVLFLDSDTSGVLTTNRCYVVSYEDEPEARQIYIEETQIPETQAETVEGTEELPVETNEDGTPVETELSEGTEPIEAEKTVAQVQVYEPETKMYSMKLDDLIGGNESEAPTDAESTAETQPVETQPVETQPVETSEGTRETVSTKETKAESTPVKERKEVIQEYRYLLGAVLDQNSTLVVIEAFYPQDANAGIQEELFETCLNSLSINNKQLRSQ